MQLRSLRSDRVEALADLGSRDAAISRKVQQVVLLGVELRKRGLGLAVQ